MPRGMVLDETDTCIKAGANEETFRVNVDYNVAWVSKREGSKHFCFQDENSTSSEYVALARKRGNNRET